MKIKSIHLNRFKRFTDLTITGLTDKIKLVVLVGPNGAGKSSIFEGMNHWYKLKGYSTVAEEDYCAKKGLERGGSWYENLVSIELFSQNVAAKDIHKSFYFRTAYRNEADFTTKELTRMGDPTDKVRLEKLNLTDAVVSSNYKMIASLTLKDVFEGKKDELSVKQLREQLIGDVQDSMSRVFDDLQLDSVGNPLVNGSFYFAKGASKGFHYKNLSAGEKSAFDLILDLVVKKQYYPEAVYCIDEPETHMHTALQAKLLGELCNIVPDAGQLWIATHSIGMLKRAREIAAKKPGTVAFIDFSGYDFDEPTELRPVDVDSAIWRKFLELAFDDFAGLIAPATIVFCEGAPEAAKNRKFDAKIYERVFQDVVPPPCFVSMGSCTEIEDETNTSYKIVKSILHNSRIIKLVDRDSKSEEEVAEAKSNGVRVLSRRHIESYLLDDEVLEKFCKSKGHPEMLAEVLAAKQQAISDSIGRGNLSDDVKSASGQIVSFLRKKFNILTGGDKRSTFLRDTIAPLLSRDMKVYQELYNDIFGE